MISKVILPLLLAAGVLSGQQPAPERSQGPPAAPDADFFHQAPPGVEESLRARLKIFYDCYLNGKFRVAYELVAEENKDDYFNRSKTTYHSYKIGSIAFSDNYTKAKVMVIANRDMVFQGHTFAVDVPMTAYWKVENGQWFWYLLYRSLRGQQTPFGVVPPEPPSEKAKVSPGSPTASPSSPPDGTKALPKIPNDPRSMMLAFDSLAWPDKPVLSLGPGNQFQDHTVLSNHSSRILMFHLEFKPLAGLKVEPAKGQIEPGQSLTVEAKYEAAGRGLPADRSARPIRIVYEGGGVVEVEVVWANDTPTKTAAAKVR